MRVLKIELNCCEDCPYYSSKIHKCKKGAVDAGNPQEPFFIDCPLNYMDTKEKFGDWIPFDIKEDAGKMVSTNPIPILEQDILVSDGEDVWLDIFRCDEDGYYMDTDGGKLNNLAWMPKPLSYKKTDKAV